ncbi:MAG: hypothetical protein B7X60_00565 [Polynucleobacter sp. 39-45-136]|jgi:hypothetical protein|nr:MAG: hypothetical protein B7X60_00565 [Polynucleobacter sp. 39-45-136]
MGRVSIQDKKKLLFIVNSTLIGGHEMQAKYLIKDFINAGSEIVLLGPTKDICDFFKGLGAIVHYAPFNFKGKLWKQILFSKKSSKIIAQYVSECKYVIVSGGSIEATINPVMAIRFINPLAHIISYVPMYIDRRHTHGWLGYLYGLFLNAIARITDEYWTINRIQAYIIKKKTGVKTSYILNRIRTVLPPIQTLGPRLVYVGRFDDKQKDIVGLLNLLDHPKNPYKNVVLIGDGPDRQIIIDAINLLQNLVVEVKGWLSSEKIDSSIGFDDILILNSRWEGEPLVVREFLAKGLTCIAKDIVGVRGVVDKKFRFKTQDQLLSILNSCYQESKSAHIVAKSLKS